MPWTDEELVARSVSGDTDSFNQLVVRWERPIYALAYRVLGHEEDARDVCQEAFLLKTRLYQGLSVLRRHLEPSGVQGTRLSYRSGMLNMPRPS